MRGPMMPNLPSLPQAGAGTPTEAGGRWAQSLRKVAQEYTSKVLYDVMDVSIAAGPILSLNGNVTNNADFFSVIRTIPRSNIKIPNQLSEDFWVIELNTSICDSVVNTQTAVPVFAEEIYNEFYGSAAITFLLNDTQYLQIPLSSIPSIGAAGGGTANPAAVAAAQPLSAQFCTQGSAGYRFGMMPMEIHRKTPMKVTLEVDQSLWTPGNLGNSVIEVSFGLRLAMKGFVYRNVSQ